MITVNGNHVRRDADGYELDDQGNRIWPPWANATPSGAKNAGHVRPPWVDPVANYWDESKPPRGWFRVSDGSWAHAGNEEHLARFPELHKMMADLLKAEGGEAPAPDAAGNPPPEANKPVEAKKEAPQGIRCTVCEKPFPNPATLMVHMRSHRKSDQHHAAALKAAEEKQAPAAGTEEVKL